jgi:hypothetical protein
MGNYSAPASSGGGSSTSVEDADANTKIQVEESSDENKIRFDTAGTERMIIDAAGNVGVGTSSPDAPLHVKSTAATSFSGLGAVAILESTDSDNAYGPSLKLFRNSGTPANGDHIGMIRFTGQDSGGNENLYAHIYAKASNTANTAEDGALHLETIHNGGSVGKITIAENITINGNLADCDVTIQGSGGSNSNLLHADAGLYRVGIGTGTPTALLDVDGALRAPKLDTVPVTTGSVNLSEATHAGRYVLFSGGSLTLPASFEVGEHYTVINTTSAARTVSAAGGDTINGGSGGGAVSIPAYGAVTFVGVVQNTTWVGLGV